MLSQKKPKIERIKNNKNLIFRDIQKIIEDTDPSLDEPVIYELCKRYIYEEEFGAPPYYETQYRTVGEKTTKGGSIPLTLREMKIIKLIGLTRGIGERHEDDVSNGDVEIKVVSKDLLACYENDISSTRNYINHVWLEQKPLEDLTDLDKSRLEQKKAEIAKTKSEPEQDPEKKGLLQLEGINKGFSGNREIYELKVTAQQANLLKGLFDEKRCTFKTHQQLQNEKKSLISFESIANAIDKILGKEGEER